MWKYQCWNWQNLQLNPTRPTGVFLRGILKVEFHFVRLIWHKVEVLCLFPPCYVLLLTFTYKSQFRDSSNFFFPSFVEASFFFSCSTPFWWRPSTSIYIKLFSRLEPRLCTWRLVDRYEKQKEERKAVSLFDNDSEKMLNQSQSAVELD